MSLGISLVIWGYPSLSGDIPRRLGISLIAEEVIALYYVAVFTEFQVVYVTATLPYILLTILLIQGATMEGSMSGVKFYMGANFTKLGEPTVCRTNLRRSIFSRITFVKNCQISSGTGKNLLAESGMSSLASRGL